MRALDPRFDGYRLHNAAVERIATDYRWAEGPVWFGDHHCLLWSDIPSNRMLCWDEATGAVTVFRSPPTTPTATPAIARAASSPAST